MTKRVKQKVDRVEHRDPDFHYPDLVPTKKRPKQNENNEGHNINVEKKLFLEDYVLSSLLTEEEKHFLNKMYEYEKGDVK